VADLQWLTYADFVGRVGQEFVLEHGQAGAVVLVLVEATESDQPGGTGPDGRERRQFSLLFSGPVTPGLAQATYRLRLDSVEIELFLVPIGPLSDGMGYEAAFA
jgi:hypothetical protein